MRCRQKKKSEQDSGTDFSDSEQEMHKRFNEFGGELVMYSETDYSSESSVMDSTAAEFDGESN